VSLILFYYFIFFSLSFFFLLLEDLSHLSHVIISTARSSEHRQHHETEARYLFSDMIMRKKTELFGYIILFFLGQYIINHQRK
jgi:hypothetical protein